MRLWNFKGEQNSITDALRLTIPEHAVICLTGAGGKTTLMMSLARELAESGRKTVITTTTHMADPYGIHAGDSSLYENLPVLFAGAAEFSSHEAFRAALREALEKTHIAMAVSRDPVKPGKVTSPGPEMMEIIYEESDAVLIEADGSRRKPFKWPAPWEPVVPDNTDFTICVAGLSALGCDLQDAVYRAEYIPDAYKRDTVDEKFMAAVLASGEGGQKDIHGEYRVFLNQADTAEKRGSASYIQKILAVCGVQSAWGMLK